MDFYENYIKLCARRGEYPTGVATKLGIEKSTVSRWARGATPRYATLIRIADYFGITVKELVGEEKEEEKKPEADNQRDDLVGYLEDMRTMGVLFDVARGASKEEIQKFAKVIAAIRGVDLD